MLSRGYHIWRRKIPDSLNADFLATTNKRYKAFFSILLQVLIHRKIASLSQRKISQNWYTKSYKWSNTKKHVFSFPSPWLYSYFSSDPTIRSSEPVQIPDIIALKKLFSDTNFNTKILDMSRKCRTYGNPSIARTKVSWWRKILFERHVLKIADFWPIVGKGRLRHRETHFGTHKMSSQPLKPIRNIDVCATVHLTAHFHNVWHVSGLRSGFTT